MKNLHTFEEFVNESQLNEASQRGKVIFSIDDDKLDTLLHSRFGKQLDYEDIKGDSYYVMLQKDFDRFIDLADSSGFDVDEESEDSVINIVESRINEGTITPMQMEMKGKTLINKISIGAKFEGELDNKAETLTVIGYGDRANAFKIFEVETSDGTKTYLKVTVMYGCNYRVMDNPRGNWDSAKGFSLKTITI